MWHHEIIEKLRKNLAELPSDMIEYNLGYAAAISDLEHIVEEKKRWALTRKCATARKREEQREE
jgi:hypothetical protein